MMQAARCADAYAENGTVVAETIVDGLAVEQEQERKLFRPKAWKLFGHVSLYMRQMRSIQIRTQYK